MIRVGVISDTHNHWDEDIAKYLKECDQVIHAGDIGSLELLEKLESDYDLTAVYGNIDGKDIRGAAPLKQEWEIDGIRFAMTHIAGYPTRYYKKVRKWLSESTPDVFICGHSHILRVISDKEYNHLHINPGACGHHGFHKIRTLIRFTVNNQKISDLEVVELGRRGRIHQKEA